TIDASARPSVAGGRAAVAVVDGAHAQGQVTAHFAMSLAITRAREHGLGCVAVRRSTHFGAAGYFARMASAAGMIGVAATNSGALVVPWQGRQPVYGTNPFAFAIPAGTHPDVVLDFATSMVAEGKMHVAKWRQETIPADWVLGGATDPAVALAQPLLPFGRYKGSGLALVAELLSAALPLAKLSTELAKAPSPIPGERRDGRGVGHFFLAIDIAAFVPLADFHARVDEMIREVKAIPPAAGFTEVLVAGEPEERAKAENEVLGIPLIPPLAASLRRLAEQIDYPFPAPIGR
ncbi:MAG: Ldh family oxidoreductase, partial [Armatimonadetes bacterium]|nr:Ldh family oxidoreductase [Armatimonadota bacterium]